MSDETYNGWKNRETWAFNLHWQNDYDLYQAVKAYAAAQRGQTPITLGRNIKDALTIACREGTTTDPVGPSLFSVDPKVLRAMRDEVGSFWRVDEVAVGEAALKTLEGSE